MTLYVFEHIECSIISDYCHLSQIIDDLTPLIHAPVQSVFHPCLLYECDLIMLIANISEVTHLSCLLE